jgi:hypothetical protein
MLCAGMSFPLREMWPLLLFLTSAFMSHAAVPLIVQQPASATVGEGTTVVLQVNATGEPPLTYRWRRNGVSVNNETQQVFSISKASLETAGDYSVLVSNTFGVATSQVAYLTVIGNFRPQRIQAVPGARLKLIIPVAGQPVTFSWMKDGTALSNLTDTLSIPSFLATDAGNYRVVVSNSFGVVEPPAAEVVATAPGPFDSWRRLSTLPGGQWNRIELVNGRYVALGSYQVANSPDALNWIATSIPNRIFYDVDFGNGLYVAAGEVSALYTSATSGSWIPRQISAFGQIRAVAYGGTQFVAVAQQELFTSPDGITWTKQTPARLDLLSDVAWGNGVFVVVSVNGNIQTSVNGMDWTETHSIPLGGLYLYRVAYGNGRFVVVGSDGYALVSLDGVRWIRQETGTLEWLAGLTFVNGFFVGMTRSSSIVSSKDGMQWTVHSRGTNQWIEPFNYNPLICGGDSTLIVGAPGNVLLESDPIINFEIVRGEVPGLAINTRTGTICQVEAKTELAASWQTVTNVLVGANPFVWRDSVTNRPMRFYRIVR